MGSYSATYVDPHGVDHKLGEFSGSEAHSILDDVDEALSAFTRSFATNRQRNTVVRPRVHDIEWSDFETAFLRDETRAVLSVDYDNGWDGQPAEEWALEAFGVRGNDEDTWCVILLEQTS